ncbi:MAG: PRC-barrel domain-containing protein [Longimicrobiales bacterium]
MGEKDRLKRDAAGIGPEPRRSGLHKMSGLKGFRVAKGEPDIRGWEVRTLNGRDVGEVDDLLVDPESGEVVFMEVAMNNSDRRIELALRHAQLDRDKKHVIVDSADVDVHGSEYTAVAVNPTDDRLSGDSSDATGLSGDLTDENGISR